MNKPRWFSLPLPKPVIVLFSLALTMFMGFLDYFTGRDFALSAFYLIPICCGTWLVGRNTGIMLATASTVAWFIADFLSGNIYRHSVTPYWNGLMLWVLYLVVVLSLSAFQTAHYHLEETVQRRTEALLKEIAARQRLEAAKLQAERLANVRLSTHFDPTLAVINVDSEQLWQAVLNLIRNSCEAMLAGGELTIGTWRDGDQVLLRVGDSGKGLTPEQVQRVFTPFYTTKKEGTGLGLALVQQIVTEHGGHVECESVSGKGTTFTIFLPLTETS